MVFLSFYSFVFSLSLAFVRFERASYALSEYLYREKGLGIWKNGERKRGLKRRNKGIGQV